MKTYHSSLCLHHYMMFSLCVCLFISCYNTKFSSVQPFSHVWLCHHMDCSMLGLPVHHHLLGGYSNSRPLSWWCHPTISSSVVPFTSCPQSFPASGSFPMSQFFASGAKVLKFQLEHHCFQWIGLISFRMDWLDLLAVQGTLKSLLQHHRSKASILWHSACFLVQLSHLYITTGKTIALTRRTFVGKVCLCFLTCCLGWS